MRKQTSDFLIPLMCITAILCPFMAHRRYTGDLLLKFVWTEELNVFENGSWIGAEALLFLGALALLVVAVYFAGVTVGLYRRSPRGMWTCLVLHLAVRPFVDAHLLRSYFPPALLWSRTSWTDPVIGWELLAFTGGAASVAAVVLQVRTLRHVSERTLARVAPLVLAASVVFVFLLSCVVAIPLGSTGRPDTTKVRLRQEDLNTQPYVRAAQRFLLHRQKEVRSEERYWEQPAIVAETESSVEVYFRRKDPVLLSNLTIVVSRLSPDMTGVKVFRETMECEFLPLR